MMGCMDVSSRSLVIIHVHRFIMKRKKGWTSRVELHEWLNHRDPALKIEVSGPPYFWQPQPSVGLVTIPINMQDYKISLLRPLIG